MEADMLEHIYLEPAKQTVKSSALSLWALHGLVLFCFFNNLFE